MITCAAVAAMTTACELPFGRGTYTVAADFRQAFNLFPGSKVRVVGVDVGRITDVAVAPGSDRVRVTMSVRDDIQLPRDVGAIIVPQALLGERYVQLTPSYSGGPELGPGAVIPLERTDVPAEFDEVLESLNTFLEGIEPEELGRLVVNLADVVDGRGEALGQTIDSVRNAIGALADTDEELVALATRLADLNETLATRDVAIGELLGDWNTLTASLVAERADIDAALSGLARMTRVVADVLEAHREDLDADIATVTRVGRTAVRNLDQLSVLLDGQAELFRGAERVFDYEHNWLPLVNHSGELVLAIEDRLNHRLAGLCIRLGIAACSASSFWDDLNPGEGICLPPLVLCPDPTVGGPTTLPDLLGDALDAVPELGEALEDEGNSIGDIVDGIGGLLGGEDGGGGAPDAEAAR